MGEISQKLRLQRHRNRVIELFDLLASLEDCAKLGAFEVINLIDDWLPVEYILARDVFSEAEREIIDVILECAANAADTTTKNSWSLAWFEDSNEWVLLCNCAKRAVSIFSERGRFSENDEQVLTVS